MLNTLHLMAQKGILRKIDYQFAKFVVSRNSESNSSLIAIVSALVSFELGKGHTCLNLNNIDQQSLFGLSHTECAELLEGLPGISEWKTVIEGLRVVSSVHLGEVKPRPLVLDGNRVYLHRYWSYECTVANQLLKRTSSSTQISMKMPEVLDKLFPWSYQNVYQSIDQLRKGDPKNSQQLLMDKLGMISGDGLDWTAINNVVMTAESAEDMKQLDCYIPQSLCINWQKVAAATALTKQFCIISGGPGTGKTTTVSRLLAALIQQANLLNETLPIIKLAAPTGKAAARLTESINLAVQDLPLDTEVKACIPSESSTIHRLLGAHPHLAGFRHNKKNTISVDVLVVDEASMIDLPMMASLLEALPESSKVIFLGDRDQLASVEAGSVFGDICVFAEQEYSRQQVKQLNELTGYEMFTANESQGQWLSQSPIADSLCVLKKSYRFTSNSGIGLLAKAINEGENNIQDLVLKRLDDIEFYELCNSSYLDMIMKIATLYKGYFDAIQQGKTATEILAAFSRSRLLCSQRQGEFGVTGLNSFVEKQLIKMGVVKPSSDAWYVGRPVMITRNDYSLSLYNGDIGIVLEEQGRKRVYFEMADGEVKGVLPSRLPEHETVYAMTVHKSQGSEFENVVFVLPTELNPVLTRELVYTGVTRAKKHLSLYAASNIISQVVKVKAQRNSGLSELLKGG